ncbi:MAG: nucleotidyltransferase domain-containing protein [Hydrogenobaculum sp.]
MKTHEIRLEKEEIEAIKEVALEVFGSDIMAWIFGSRTDLNKKGGDIDIYIEIKDFDIEKVVKKKIEFLVRLENKIGEQKVDVVVSPYGCQERHCQEAKNTGIRIL